MSMTCGRDRWSIGRLSSLVNVVYGKSPAEIEKLDDGIPIFGTGGVVGYTSEALCDGPSVILGRKGTIDKVQRSAGPFWAIDTTYYTTPKRAFDWSWLYYVISSFDLRKLNEASGVPSLSRSSLESLDIATPPLEEQQKIAAILTTVDDKLDVLARQIEATQILKQCLMQTLFSRGVGTQDAHGRWAPHTEFKDSNQGCIPVNWTMQTLEQVAVVERGKFSARPRNDPRYFNSGDVPFIQTGDVANGGRVLSTASQFLNKAGLGVSKLFEAGTIFLTIAANIGDVAIAAVPMACPDSVVGIRAIDDACDPAWLYYLLAANKGYFDSRATQNAQKNINLQVLRPFAFALPPFAEQVQIGRTLTAVDEKLECMATRRLHYQALKRGLMQKLLTGEWQVKVDTAMAA